ncbi:MAG: MarR family transcriptional regulator [Candidatus Bipolaricaulota bacterium]|nr:MarR family transcriptional regulator [Candidatus Bipolaricaulota bacterium]
MVLFHLGREDGLPQGELARQTLVRPATLTEVLQRMEAAGLIERRADPVDGRVSRVYLTEKGRRARRQAEEIWADLEGQLARTLTSAEQGELRRLLEKLRQALAKEEP